MKLIADFSERSLKRKVGTDVDYPGGLDKLITDIRSAVKRIQELTAQREQVDTEPFFQYATFYTAHNDPVEHYSGVIDGCIVMNGEYSFLTTTGDSIAVIFENEGW